MSPISSSDQSWGRIRNRQGLYSRAVIRRLVERIAERFQPDKIILFGSYAYGQPNPESDIDLLVVMPARNELDQSLKIALTIDPPFGFDLIVRTPKNLEWRLEEGDWFLREAVGKGKVVYEKPDPAMGPKSRGRLRRNRETSKR
ncbi:MAG TPA: nucleotidyltransferase domain-containing protein [Gemmataceae bacterium]|jgi:predicted nucleotidyltransferase|nr:nucleotidyltransferase domain-containing protein [Gemmataceae bacterium]